MEEENVAQSIRFAIAFAALALTAIPAAAQREETFRWSGHSLGAGRSRFGA
jgi:hypothetical protein